MDLAAAGLKEQAFPTHGKPLSVVSYASFRDALEILWRTCESPTGLALIPLALGGDPGKEIQSPMAIVILGGLFTSTVLNMIVVPSLFYKFGGTKMAVKE